MSLFPPYVSPQNTRLGPFRGKINLSFLKFLKKQTLGSPIQDSAFKNTPSFFANLNTKVCEVFIQGFSSTLGVQETLSKYKLIDFMDFMLDLECINDYDVNGDLIPWFFPIFMQTSLIVNSFLWTTCQTLELQVECRIHDITTCLLICEILMLSKCLSKCLCD